MAAAGESSQARKWPWRRTRSTKSRRVCSSAAAKRRTRSNTAGAHGEERLEEVGRERRGEFEGEEADREGSGGGDFAEGGEIAGAREGNEETLGRRVL